MYVYRVCAFGITCNRLLTNADIFYARPDGFFCGCMLLNAL